MVKGKLCIQCFGILGGMVAVVLGNELWRFVSGGKHFPVCHIVSRCLWSLKFLPFSFGPGWEILEQAVQEQRGSQTLTGCPPLEGEPDHCPGSLPREGERCPAPGSGQHPPGTYPLSQHPLQVWIAARHLVKPTAGILCSSSHGLTTEVVRPPWFFNPDPRLPEPGKQIIKQQMFGTRGKVRGGWFPHAGLPWSGCSTEGTRLPGLACADPRQDKRAETSRRWTGHCRHMEHTEHTRAP